GGLAATRLHRNPGRRRDRRPRCADGGPRRPTALAVLKAARRGHPRGRGGRMTTETSPVQACPEAAPAAPRYRSDGAADRAMRRLLGVAGTDRRSSRGAHNAFRVSVFISAIRCLITYV